MNETNATEISTGTTNGSENLTDQEFMDLFSFDPFKEPAPEQASEAPSADQEAKTPPTETQPAQATKPAETSAPTAAAPEAAPAPTPTPAATADVKSDADVIADLRKELEAQKAATAAFQQQQAQFLAQIQQQQAAPQQQQPTETDPFSYDFQLPDQLVAAMASEIPEERRHGIKALVDGVAASIHRRVIMETQQMVTAGVPQLIAQSEQSRSIAKTVNDDFYGTYKELDRPELRPIVQHFAMQLMQETGQTSWSPAFRDQLGQRVRAVLQPMQAQVPPQAQMPVSPQAPVAPQLPYVAGNGSRPAPAQRTLSDEIASVFTA